jgi:hypothetical protein
VSTQVRVDPQAHLLRMQLSRKPSDAVWEARPVDLKAPGLVTLVHQITSINVQRRKPQFCQASPTEGIGSLEQKSLVHVICKVVPRRPCQGWSITESVHQGAR